MHILLLPFGSSGDVFPYIWLGRQLLARGHRVTMITGQGYAEQARAAGLAFVAVGETDEISAMARDPRFWTGGLGAMIYFTTAALVAAATLAAIESCGGADLMIAPSAGYGARMAREKRGIPLITVHIHTVTFPSVYETPFLGRGLSWLRRMPPWVKRILFNLPHKLERAVLPLLRRACRSAGVRAPWLPMHWQNSPDGVLVLFPDWHAAPQPDWPQPHFQWSFPLEDLGAEIALEPELAAFLKEGSPPVVFTPGSMNPNAARFFEVALEAVTRLGCSAVFVTGKLSQLPANLPPQVLAVKYAPFRELLADVSVFVHHGGMGTMSLAYQAGVPQLIQPLAHDQPDNAERLVRNGAGLSLYPDEFTPENVTHCLRRLLEDASFKSAALSLAEKVRVTPAPDAMLRWLESRAIARARS